MSWVSVGIAGAGLVIQGIGRDREAKAAQGAAEAKERMAQSALSEARGSESALLAAVNDPNALRRMETALDAQQRQVQRQERLVESIDPAIKEAASQALQLLQGKEAASLGPAKQQREQQRQQLVNTLRERLGPGAETSSAGIQALGQFDQQTNQLLAQQQQSSLAGLLGISAQSKPDVGISASRLAQTSQAATGQQLNAIARGGALKQGAFGAAINTSGSQFVGEGLRGAGMGQLGSSLTTLGLSRAFSGGFGSKDPKPTPFDVGPERPMTGGSNFDVGGVA